MSIIFLYKPAVIEILIKEEVIYKITLLRFKQRKPPVGLRLGCSGVEVLP